MISRERFGKLFAAIDFHFADFVARTSGEQKESIWLAAGLASAYARQGNVCVDLSAYASIPLLNDMGEIITMLPDYQTWRQDLLACKGIAEPGEFAPLILDSNRLYLYRYWRCESSLMQQIRTRLTRESPLLNKENAQKGIRNLFGTSPGDQKLAAAGALLNSVCMISGGPGTGKTTTVARIVSLLLDQNPLLRIALSAPTGKAAARLQQTIQNQAATLPHGALFPVSAQTLHRLLGATADGRSYRFGRENLLPCDVVIVDEASMVDLELMTALFEAASPETRIILLGDRDQLPSVEGGNIFGDLCHAPETGQYGPKTAARLSDLTGMDIRPAPEVPAIREAVYVLRTNYRFAHDSGIALLSESIKRGDANTALEILRAKPEGVAWFDPSEIPHVSRWLQEKTFDAYRPYISAQDPQQAFAEFGKFRVLCAIREGPSGVDALNALVLDALVRGGLVKSSQNWFLGKPILVLQNDYGQQLFNGDTGLVLPDPSASGGLRAFFPKGDEFRSILPAQLPQHETAFAMTVHKTQGSEFDHVLLILPEKTSPVLCRELVYTAVTRARKKIEILASAEILQAAIKTQTVRASGLISGLYGGK